MRSYVWSPTSATSTGDYINYEPISVTSQSARPLRVEYDTFSQVYSWDAWSAREEERIIDELNRLGNSSRLWPSHDIIDTLGNHYRVNQTENSCTIDRADAAPEPEPELPELDAFLESLRAPTENA